MPIAITLSVRYPGELACQDADVSFVLAPAYGDDERDVHSLVMSAIRAGKLLTLVDVDGAEWEFEPETVERIVTRTVDHDERSE